MVERIDSCTAVFLRLVHDYFQVFYWNSCCKSMLSTRLSSTDTFLIYINSWLLCCCPLNTVGVGRNHQGCQFRTILKQRHLCLVPSLQALLSEALTLSVSVICSFSNAFSPSDCLKLVFPCQDFFKLEQIKHTNVLYRTQFSLLGLYLLQIVEFR